MKTTLLLLMLLAPCLFVAAEWGEWTSWSECKCDQKETRSRECVSPPCSGPEEETRACSCTPIDLQEACSHVCYTSGCVSGFVADPCDCSCFYHCVRAGDHWTATQQCCNLCEVWDDYPKTCVRNASDPNCIFPATTQSPGDCPLSSGSSETTFVVGGIEMSCSSNTKFSLAACACVHDGSDLPLQGLISCITFDQPRPYGAVGDAWVDSFDVEIVNDPSICNVSGNCGYFDSTKKAHLEIPYFAGIELNEFAFSFWYLRTPNNYGSMGLVNNGNCEINATISLISGAPGINCGWLKTDEDYFGKTGHDAADGGWHMYTMSYNGSYVAVYSDTTFADGQVLTGKTIITQCPMTIGSFLCKEFFDGHMDSVAFFKTALTASDVMTLYINRGACSP